MSKKQNILEQALLQLETLEEAVKQNSKGVIASSMKQELKNLVKEQEEEEDEDETDVEADTDTDVEADTDTEDVTPDFSGETPQEDELPSDEEDFPMDDMGGEDDVLDMTGSTDTAELVRVFKALRPEDGVIVKKTDGQIELKTGDDEFIIKTDETNPTDELNEQEEMDDDSIYEIDLDSELTEDDFSDEPMFDDDEDFSDTQQSDDFGDDFSDDEYKGDDDFEDINFDDEFSDDEFSDDEFEGDFNESSRTKGFGYRGGLKSKKMYKAGNKRDQISENYKKLVEQNKQYKKALVQFKNKLNEIAVFNANLAYATKLFTEHSTTKKEKLDILQKFDKVEKLEDSKKLFESLKTELKNKKPISETIDEKIVKTPKSSSKQVITETKAYEDPKFKRIKELMGKIK